MLEVLVQHVRDHAQHYWKVAGDEIVVAADGLIFEVDDDDPLEDAVHFNCCFAPIRRNKPG